MNKRMFSIVLVVVMMFSSVQLAFANERDSYDRIEGVPTQLFTIDFTSEPTAEEKVLLQEYYRTDAERVFNQEFAERLFNENSAEIRNTVSRNGVNDQFMKEQALSNSIGMFNSNASLGTFGDILVTYSFSSFGINIAAVGHAAIVHNDSSYTIESFPDGGVRVYNNDWGSKSRVYGVRVRGASYSDYQNAASYAVSQADAQKPYNWNFFNKGTTDSFYCSQLVWRAWKNQGYEVDRMNLGDWEPVSPAELVGGSQTYVFYTSN